MRSSVCRLAYVKYRPGSHPMTLRSNPHTYKFLKEKKVSLIGAPFHEGQLVQTVANGPEALRQGGLPYLVESLGWKLKDLGNLDMAGIMEPFPAVPATPERNVRNCERVGAGLQLLHDTIKKEALEGNFVLTMGGDHSVGSATCTAMKAAHNDLSVVWVDAHADCNTPDTSPSGNYHGMPAAHAMGWMPKPLPGFEWLKSQNWIHPSRMAFIGLRDIDENEQAYLRDNAVAVYTMHEVDKWGIGQVVQMAMDRVNPHNNRPVHLSFDIDSCDPTIAPGTGTCCRGGLSYREAHYICESLSMSNCLVSMDIVEVNPDLDEKVPGRMHGDNPMLNTDLRTVQLGLELCASALGRTILGEGKSAPQAQSVYTGSGGARRRTASSEAPL